MILFTIVVYSIFIFLSDFRQIYSQLRYFDFILLAPILIVIFASWMALFVRWVWLLRMQGVKIPFKNNLLIYLAGYSLSVTPAKSGEFLKSVLLKKQYNVKQSFTVAIIVQERFFDIVGTLIVSILAIGLIKNDFLSFSPLIFLVCITIFLTSYKKISESFFERIYRIRFFQRYTSSFENVNDVLKNIQRPKILIFSTTLTMVYRLLEAAGIYLILMAVGIGVSDYFVMAGTYSLSVILGTISFSPGGLGVTEGSFGGLLFLQNIELSKTFAIAIIVRLFTLWFAVLVGFIALKLSNSLNNEKKS